MKKKVLALFSAILLIAGCSEEEIIEPVETVNVETSVQSLEAERGLQINGLGGTTIQIHYNHSLTISEIEDIRREYFLAFPCLDMCILQPTDPYQDVWCHDCKAGDENEVQQTVANDPRLGD
ncbi:hypothetical protein GWK08_13780 [Leptobacterium flavescens]|uniref:Uncharacterized protein n=1 Tax=Leptobacterium flavescens TaxID=472055 RepID=A0A6P0URV4_9FLAO|nr:hypothetical protein [Leptobacterium flavescens]NER14519.1 hypothetical protein [Leptobacterium flavescens]